MSNAKRLFVIGYDGMNYRLLQRFLQEGCLPTIQSLLERGSLNRLLCTIPAWTPTNWSSLVTGAPAGTHQLGGWTVREKTDPLGRNKRMSWEYDAYDGAETLWKIADNKGLKNLITHYPPGSWKSPLEHGFVVAPGVHDAPLHYAMGMRYFATIQKDVQTRVDQPGADLDKRSTDVAEEGAPPGSSIVRLEPVNGWQNAGEKDLGCPLTVVLSGGKETHTLYLHVRRDADGRFEKVAICRQTDTQSAFVDVPPQGWSPFGFTRIGPESNEAAVRFRIMASDPKAGTLDLVRSCIYGTRGYAQPEGLDNEILEHCGPFFDRASVPMVRDDAHLEAWLDEMRYQGEWEVSVARHIQETRGWDLHFSHWHPFDWINHASINGLDPDGPEYDPERAEWLLEAQRKTYKMGDDILKQFLELEKDGDLVCLMSDHGMSPTHRFGSIPDRLEETGLLVRTPEGTTDWAKSKTYLIPERGSEVYINLEGREPEGTVPPDQYENVQEAIIGALLDWKDPAIDKRPIALALKLQDAQIIGYWGHISGDVVFTMNRGFGWGKPLDGGTVGKARAGQHGSQIPTSETPYASNMACFILSGPGVHVGYERDWQRWGVMRMIDMAPTFAHLLGLRTPRHNMGAIMHDLLVD